MKIWVAAAEHALVSATKLLFSRKIFVVITEFLAGRTKL